MLGDVENSELVEQRSVLAVLVDQLNAKPGTEIAESCGLMLDEVRQSDANKVPLIKGAHGSMTWP